ncbi:rhodanese-like domain-containing protein [Nocardiopsis coralliicola]
MSATIDTADAQALPAGTAVFLDVRTAGEFESAHIAGAVNLPVDKVGAHSAEIAGAERRIVVVCQAGPRAEQAAAALSAAGAADVAVLAGGMNAWTSSGAPVELGTERWALERQVRLVAGSIVLVAVLASIAWEPAKYVAAFIGAGLTFAALSNTCAMALLLSKLPYNRPAAATDPKDAVAAVTGASAPARA